MRTEDYVKRKLVSRANKKLIISIR